MEHSIIILSLAALLAQEAQFVTPAGYNLSLSADLTVEINKMKSILFPVLAIILVSCASMGTVPSEVTVTSTPPPTETPMPTATATPLAVDGVADVNGILYFFDESAQEWTALPELDADFSRVLVTEDERIVAVDADGEEVYALDMATGEWVKKLSETAVAVELEGNPYSGQGIEVTTLNEITLSQDDLPMMADYLDALAAAGLMPERDVTAQRGAMQLTDLKMSSENGDSEGGGNMLQGAGWQPMFKVESYDLRTYRWRELNTRPVMLAFDYVGGGKIFAVMMPDKDGDLRVTDWRRMSGDWVVHFGDKIVDATLSYGSVPKLSIRKYVPIVGDFENVNACVEYAMSGTDEEMREFCEQVVAQRADLRKEYGRMLQSGEVSKRLRDGDLITLLSFAPAHP